MLGNFRLAAQPVPPRIVLSSIESVNITRPPRVLCVPDVNRTVLITDATLGPNDKGNVTTLVPRDVKTKQTNSVVFSPQANYTD
jgi:hypothetical protein